MVRPFNVMLPPGWAQFDLSQPAKQQVRDAVEVMLSSVPESLKGEFREQLEAPIRSALTQMAGKGAVAAYLSVENPITAAVFPVVAIRPADFTVGDDVLDPLDYMVALVSTGQVELIDLAGMVGVKRVTDRDASAALQAKITELPEELLNIMDADERKQLQGASQVTRQVEYTLGVPETEDCWMVVAAEISSSGGDGAHDALDAVTEFLDAWVGTITWQQAEVAHD